MANQPNGSALTTVAENKPTVHGTYREPKAVAQRLDYAIKNYNLVSPATSCGTLPEGFSLAFSLVTVDVDRDTYEVGDLLGLSKTALDLISNAAGVSWDTRESGRVDDGSDPHYCAWKAVGHVQDFDGRVRVLPPGSKEMDLRADSAQVSAMYARYEAAQRDFSSGKRKYAPKNPEGQIREMRLHIQAHAETKARLRAIRTLGIRAGYTAAELKKPFCVVRLMATGETNDPELRKLFAVAKFQAALEPSRLLYGDQPPRAPQGMAMPLAMPSSPPMPAIGGGSARRLAPPPPVGTVPADDEDFIEAPTPEPTTGAAPTQSASAPIDVAQPSAPNGSPRRTSSGLAMKFGKGKDQPIEDLSEKNLRWYIDVLEKDLVDPEKSRFRANTEKNLRALKAELAARGAGGGGSGGGAEPPSFDEFSGGGSDDEIPF